VSHRWKQQLLFKRLVEIACQVILSMFKQGLVKILPLKISFSKKECKDILKHITMVSRDMPLKIKNNIYRNLSMLISVNNNNQLGMHFKSTIEVGPLINFRSMIEVVPPINSKLIIEVVLLISFKSTIEVELPISFK